MTSKKMKMEDDLNFKAVLLRLFNNKNLKTNGFDTIEIDLVSTQLHSPAHPGIIAKLRNKT